MLSPAHPARSEAPLAPHAASDRTAERGPKDAPCFAELLASTGERGARGGEGPLVVAIGARTRSLSLELDGPALSHHAARALAAVLRDAVRRRERAVELRLRPSELGGLVIRISLEGTSLVHLEATASDPRVGERLLAGRQELERALARWGLCLGRLSVRAPELAAEGVPCATEGEGEPGSEADERSRRSFFEVVI